MRIQSPYRKTLAAVSGVLLATAAVVLAQAPHVAAATTGPESNYLVLYQSGASSTGAASTISSAGGTLVANYSQIGVVVARSSATDFATRVSKAGGVSGVSKTDGFATRLKHGQQDSATSQAVTAAATWGDSLSGDQWDMTQIHVPQAHEVNVGSSSVLVGDIDTGLDFTHPDLVPNYDAANSADCTSGAPSMLLPGNDVNGHGTHTAGTIAAAANGTGVVGVAPGVRIAGIRAGDADGFFFPEAVVCSFMWAATHGVDITNNSYFADPWLFNCKNDPEQRAIWTAERRAIAFAQNQGVTVIAAEGNESDDLSHPTQDVTSPDNTTPVTREISNACAVVPVEVPGVIGVTATGSKQLKSFYSSYGISTADVAAPGGDSVLQPTPPPGGGRVLSTFSSNGTICAPARLVVENGARYCYLQGTSMAAPHAVGVAALIASAQGLHGRSLGAALQQATNRLACPADVSPWAPFPSVSNGAPQTCTGGIGHNSWYGSGEVDALKAVK
jgi:lantibiotic leader peptide-processing serine protease